jgi:hypothetical protein
MKQPSIQIYNNNTSKIDIKKYLENISSFASKKLDSCILDTDSVVISQENILIPLVFIDNDVNIETMTSIFHKKKEIDLKVIDEKFYIDINLNKISTKDYSIYLLAINIVLNLCYIVNFYLNIIEIPKISNFF